MEYMYVTHREELLTYLPSIKQAKVIAVDTETTGLDPHTDKLRLIQIAAAGSPVLILDCFKLLPDCIDVIKDILESSGVKVFQNAKFDLQFFIALGIYPSPIFDTMLAGQLLRTSDGAQRVNIAALAKHYLNEDIDKGEQTSDWSGSLCPSQLIYAALDAEVLLRLREVMVKKIYEHNLSAIAKIEFSCAHALAQMEYAGISMDIDRWNDLTVTTERERDEVLESLYAFTGRPIVQMNLWDDAGTVVSHNFDSNQYILGLLHQNGIPVKTTSKKDISAYSNYPLIKAITAYRKAAKSLSGFLYPMPHMLHPQTGRLHPKYFQIAAPSGRMSCGGPNIQQIPRDQNFRACFVASEGRKLIVADYSQIELRVAAQISGDRRMTAAYRNGEDLHTLTASLVSRVRAEEVTKAQRQAAKAVNFGLIFGMGAPGLQQYARQAYGVDMTLEQATAFRDSFFKAYTGIAAWHRRVKDTQLTTDRTLAGRKLLYGEEFGLAGKYNTPVQGTAADIAKSALGMIAQRVAGTGTYIVATVHDEILLEADDEDAPTVAAMLKEAMERAGNDILVDVPCVADVSIMDSWAGK